MANQPSSPMPKRRAPAARRAPNWIAPVAALVLVVFGALVFSLIPRHANTSTVGTAQKTATKTPTHVGPGTWKLVPSLSFSGDFSAENFPVVAPSNPNVVYEVLAHKLSNMIIRRTDDAGKTWHVLPFPIPGNHILGTSLFVNPLNAQQIHISIYDTVGTDCPAGYGQNGQNEGSWTTWCQLQYVSKDGGQTWAFETLPLHGTFTPSIGNNKQPIRAQGSQLYAALACGDFSCTRFVASTDGGHTWSLVDAPIAAAKQTLCDDAVPTNGTTIYALSSVTCLPQDQGALTLWASTDGGAHWTHNGPLPTPNEYGMAAYGNLVYAELPVTTQNHKDKTGSGNYVVTSYNPQDLQVTTDGGATWQHAPTAGAPANLQLLQVLGVLQDGSVVGEFAINGDTNYDFNGATLATWKAGQAAWKPLGNATSGNIGMLVVAPSTTQPLGDLWLVQPNRFNNEGTFLHYQP